MKKILLVSHSQKLGGAERCLYELASGLMKQYEVIITLPSKGENFQMFNELGCKLIFVSYPWWLHFSYEKISYYKIIRKTFSQLYAILKFCLYILKIEPAFIISNTSTVAAAALASKILGKKHYWFLHELLDEDHGLKFDYGWKFSTIVISHTSKKIFVNSKFVKSKFGTFIKEEKLQVINMNVPKPSITLAQENNLDPRVINLYVIGQIQSGKGQLMAIKAHQILLKKNYISRLTIIGSVSDKDYFELITNYIDSNSITAVEFKSFAIHPFQHIASNAIGLMCSEFEAFGRVTIEFMKVGIPVVGCNSGETKNIIQDGYTGLLFMKNDASDLSAKILALVTNSDMKNEIVKRAKLFAEETFNATDYFQQIHRVLNA
ncbi:MAG TPA: glycosyltransferase family 4 protein [Saprospiraceae bacterium]|nr:glycosyltransferase family 4 protein [Saprospiraceae bacterium]HNT19443.1 glycosyltransferase family 4 protein [Saprospiraceae bacterium]